MAVLKQAELGVPVAELIRQVGITRDRPGAGTLWLSQDPCLVEAGGLERGKEAGIPLVQGRRLDVAA